MGPLRMTAVASTLLSSSMLFTTDCSTDPPDEVCPPDAPQEGCACDPALEGQPGCTADGAEHPEAFVCVNGVWTDLQGTDQADATFCGSADAWYAGCIWYPGDEAMQTICAVPGFIGIGRARRRDRASARRVRAI